MLDLQQHPHRRYNALNGEWVLVSPHRTSRPWQGQVESAVAAMQPSYDPDCYLCPGNARAGGERNPDFHSTFVFTNDFSALLPEVPAETNDVEDAGLVVAAGEPGICRVMCFSPRHDLTLATMKVSDIKLVVDEWCSQSEELGKHPDIHHVQIFENRGAMMGASNPHPHCQIWATHTIPNEAAKEIACQRTYHASKKSCLLCDYGKLEGRLRERVIFENNDFLVVVPYWAIWPFETLVLSKRHMDRLAGLTPGERESLAEMLNRVTAGYDRIFSASFPYSMGFHQAPTDAGDHSSFHLHAHFFPPLLRSASIRKFMVGFEMLGMPQRDITPESAAARLRECCQMKAA